MQNVPYRREDPSFAPTSLRGLSWSHCVTRRSEHPGGYMIVLIYFFQNILLFTLSWQLFTHQPRLVRPPSPRTMCVRVHGHRKKNLTVLITNQGHQTEVPGVVSPGRLLGGGEMWLWIPACMVLLPPAHHAGSFHDNN